MTAILKICETAWKHVVKPDYDSEILYTPEFEVNRKEFEQAKLCVMVSLSQRSVFYEVILLAIL